MDNVLPMTPQEPSQSPDVDFIQKRLLYLRVKLAMQPADYNAKDSEEYERLCKLKLLLEGKPTNINQNNPGFSDLSDDELI